MLEKQATSRELIYPTSHHEFQFLEYVRSSWFVWDRPWGGGAFYHKINTKKNDATEFGVFIEGALEAGFFMNWDVLVLDNVRYHEGGTINTLRSGCGRTTGFFFFCPPIRPSGIQWRTSGLYWSSVSRFPPCLFSDMYRLTRQLMLRTIFSTILGLRYFSGFTGNSS